MTIIVAKTDLYNGGKCFTKDREYEVPGPEVRTEAGLMERIVVNDIGENHVIGSWWRQFTIKTEDDE